MSLERPVTAPLTPSHRSPAAPIFLWLLIQLVALSLGAFRAPLSARFPGTGEQFAIQLLLATQITAAALLFPYMLRDATTSAMAILTTFPLLQLAAYLSSVPLTRAGLSAAYLACWLTTLALWRRTWRTPSAAMLGVAAALAWSVGAAVIWFTHAEARDPGPIRWSRDSLFGSLLGGIEQTVAPASGPGSWAISLALLLVSAVAAVVTQRRRNRRVERSGNPPELV